MGDLEELIAGTQEQLGALITKPKLSRKLLGKPPFRFLHDIVFALGRHHGFPNLDIFDESELVGKAIKDRDAKIAFLDKVVREVENATGQQVTLRPNKVVAGLEPEQTNIFLQELASVASGGGGGGGGGGGPEDRGDGGKEEEAAAAAAAEEEERRRQQAEQEEYERQQQRKQQQREEEDRRRAAEEEDRRRREADEAAAAAAAQADAGKQAEDDGGKDGGEDDNPLNGPVRADGQIPTTQALIGSIISKPRMSEKLLSKPPYRFLHDIVMRLEAKTGFAAGLFEGDERNGKIKDRDLKVAFLTKLINCISFHLNVSIAARPAKIVAGMEPELTNEMLQYLAFAATRGDTSEAVQRVLNGETPGTDGDGGGRSRGASPANNQQDLEAEAQRERQRQAEAQAAAEQAEYERKQAQRAREQEAAAAAAAAAARAEEEQRKAKEAAAAASAYSGAAAPAPAPAPAAGGVRRLARPTTARRRPPRVRENVQQVEGAEAVKPSLAVGIMAEGEQSDSDDDIPDEPVPETKGDEFGSGGGAGGAGKLTRDILDAERSAAESKKPTAEEPKKRSGIRMGRIKKAGTSGASYSQVDIDKLRGYIQKLCQSTNPLGKCMDYVLEDIEAMKGELSAWQADYKRRCQDLEVEQEATKDELQPLERELKEADDKIQDEVNKINTVKAKIAKNDARIQELLRMVVSW